MSRLRLRCIDVGALGDEAAEALVPRVLAEAAADERLLCFGKAARIAGRIVREEREVREGRWLDAAAGWLLAGRANGDPPQRPGSSGLAARLTVIGRSGLDAGGLPVSERYVELTGGLLVMGVASDQLIDDVDNAHLWLVGGRPFAVDTGQGRAGGRAVVGVGDGVVSIVIDGHDATITPRSVAGIDGEPVVVGLGGSNRMSVRGASA